MIWVLYREGSYGTIAKDMSIVKKRFKKIVPLAIIGLVVMFFVVNISLLSMSGEDILHKYTTEEKTMVETIVATYKYLPRIGEFYQKALIKYYTYQISPSDALLRAIDIAASVLSIALMACLVLGRKMKATKVTDSIVFGLMFLLMACLSISEVYSMRFSYIHNYVPIMCLLSIVLYILFWQKSKKKVALFFDVIASFAFGFSNEIAPIAMIIITVAIILFEKKAEGIKVKEIAKRFSKEIAVLIGLILGLVFMLGNGSILSRSSTTYGQVYDYVSFFAVFKAPLYTIKHILLHLAYNARHLYALGIILFFYLAYMIKAKKTLKEICADKRLVMEISCFVLAVLYWGGTSQIALKDDLESRLLSPAALGLSIGVASMVFRIINSQKDKLRLMKPYIGGAVLAVVLVAFGDLSIIRISEYRQYRNEIEMIRATESSEVCLLKGLEYQSDKSMVFEFTQFSPFEEWIQDYTDVEMYGKKLRYNSTCEVK